MNSWCCLLLEKLTLCDSTSLQFFLALLKSIKLVLIIRISFDTRSQETPGAYNSINIVPGTLHITWIHHMFHRENLPISDHFTAFKIGQKWPINATWFHPHSVCLRSWFKIYGLDNEREFRMGYLYDFCCRVFLFSITYINREREGRGGGGETTLIQTALF